MNNQWNTLPTEEILQQTVEQLSQRGFNPQVVANKEAALAKLKELLPAGAEVAHGSSTTLIEIGFIDYLNNAEHGWDDYSAKVRAEDDDELRSALRRKAVTSDYFLASANAITQDGQIVAADLTGSRVSAFPFAADKLILVIGTNKITSNLDAAMQRVRDHVFPLENARAQKAYGMGSAFGKWVIMEREINPQRVTVILVKEALGF